MKALHTVAFILVIVGGLNWGLAIFDVDIASWGIPDMVATVVYALVALSAVYLVATHKKDCKNCSSTGSSMGGQM